MPFLDDPLFEPYEPSDEQLQDWNEANDCVNESDDEDDEDDDLDLGELCEDLGIENVEDLNSERENSFFAT